MYYSFVYLDIEYPFFMGINFEIRGLMAASGQLYMHRIHMLQLNLKPGFPLLFCLIFFSGQLLQQVPQEVHCLFACNSSPNNRAAGDSPLPRKFSTLDLILTFLWLLVLSIILPLRSEIIFSDSAISLKFNSSGKFMIKVRGIANTSSTTISYCFFRKVFRKSDDTAPLTQLVLQPTLIKLTHSYNPEGRELTNRLTVLGALKPCTG